MADRPDIDRLAGRLAACREDVATRPYSHPIAVGWYAEDVAALLADRDRLADALHKIKSAPDVRNARDLARWAIAALSAADRTEDPREPL